MIKIVERGAAQSLAHMQGRINRMRGAIGVAVAHEAQLLRRTMVEGLRNQAPGGRPIRPLSPMTIMLRGLGNKKISGGSRRKMGSRQQGPLAGGQRRSFRPRRSRGRRNMPAGASGPLARGQKRSRGQKSRTPRKGPSKALIRRGDLLRSITAKRGGQLSWTVGVHRGSRGSKGKGRMEDIAAIQEYGTKTYSVTVTKKMRNFSLVLMSAGILKAPWKVGSKLRRRIPPRPFLRPAYDEWNKGADERFRARVSIGIAGVR